MSTIDDTSRAEPAGAVAGRRFPVGLRHFLLTTLAVGIWSAYWIVQPQVAPLHESVLAMRVQAGRLVIDDPTKIHALELSSLQDRHFRFRVYLPENPPYTLSVKTSEIYSGEFGDTAPITLGIDPGEHLIELAAIEQSDKTHLIELSVDDEVVGSLVESEDWATRSASWNSIGKSSQVTLTPLEEDHQLLRLRFVPEGQRIGPDYGPATGLLMWLSPSE